MRFPQPSLSAAASRASSHVSSSILRSPRMVSGQFFLGLPLPLFRPGVQFNTCLAFLFMFILATCPSHVSLFLLMMQPSSFCLVLSLIILFGILSLHVTCNILLSRRLQSRCAASSLLPFATVIGHVSAPYSNVLSTMDSYSRTLVSTLQSVLFHIFSNFPNTAFALPIRVLISLSQLLSNDIALPK